MLRWTQELLREFGILGEHVRKRVVLPWKQKHPEHPFLLAGLIAAGLVLLGGLIWAARSIPDVIAIGEFLTEPAPSSPDLTKPVRPEPARFRAGTHLPRWSEKLVVGPLRVKSLIPKADLVRVDDSRVWWDSDQDKNDNEDDHLMHRRMEEPLRRLIELVDQRGGVLEVHDAYRLEGVHAKLSFHKEGRALDLTCDQLGLEKLAKLAWAAGFDWVYYEAPKKGGAHVHASVKAR